MIRVVAITFAFLGSQVQALSCAFMDIPQIYQSIAASETKYLPVLGRFTAKHLSEQPAQPTPNDPIVLEDGSLIPPIPVGQNVLTEFTGMALNRHNFSTPINIDVLVETRCLAEWCGHVPGNKWDYMAMIEVTDDGYKLSIGPCDQFVQFDPSKAEVQQFVNCHKGQSCVSSYQ